MQPAKQIELTTEMREGREGQRWARMSEVEMPQWMKSNKKDQKEGQDRETLGMHKYTLKRTYF